MKKLLVLLLVTLPVFAGTLPNASITTGEVRTSSKQDICSTATFTVRNVPESEKKAVYKAYNLTNYRTACAQGMEVDHLISLELGGSNDIKNLWPQSYCGQWSAHDKDKLENELHRQVCAGKMTVPDAQTCIASNWITCYQKVMK